VQPDIAAYISVMEEIKRRTEIVFALRDETLTLKYRIVQVEAIVLQVRIILELIALASLAANKDIFEKHQKKFEDHWAPTKILADVERLNPKFFPIPIVETRGVENRLTELKKGFLTRNELIQIHGRCGTALHAHNPYSKKFNVDAYEKEIPNWISRIIKLLNCHKIQLLDDNERFFLVHMKENTDDRVHMYTFQRVSDAEQVVR